MILERVPRPQPAMSAIGGNSGTRLLLSRFSQFDPSAIWIRVSAAHICHTTFPFSSGILSCPELKAEIRHVHIATWRRGSDVAARGAHSSGRCPSSKSDHLRQLRSGCAPFHEGLKETGYVEGKNIAIDYRWAEQMERLTELAAELASPAGCGNRHGRTLRHRTRGQGCNDDDPHRVQRV